MNQVAEFKARLIAGLIVLVLVCLGIIIVGGYRRRRHRVGDAYYRSVFADRDSSCSSDLGMVGDKED